MRSSRSYKSGNSEPTGPRRVCFNIQGAGSIRRPRPMIKRTPVNMTANPTGVKSNTLKGRSPIFCMVSLASIFAGVPINVRGRAPIRVAWVSGHEDSGRGPFCLAGNIHHHRLGNMAITPMLFITADINPAERSRTISRRVSLFPARRSTCRPRIFATPVRCQSAAEDEHRPEW